MGLSPVVIENFPGLDLRADPGDSRAAIDALNVTLEPGRVRTRDGSALFFTTAINPVMLATYTASSHIIIATANTNPGTFYAVTAAGTLVASTTLGGNTTNPMQAVNYGTPTNSYLYIGNPLISTLIRWDGTTWTFPAVLPAGISAPQAIGVSPSDNRLVLGYHDRVHFSDQGAPETYSANNFVQLDPGDGENVAGMAAFANQLIVFKKTKYYVFYGTSSDPSGNPVFNYRRIATGIGAVTGVNGQAIVSAPDGVYFVGNDGIYRTTGGAPTKISAALDPFFTDASASPFWQGGELLATSRQSFTRLYWFDGNLYVSLPVTGGVVLFVYTAALGAWSAWSVYSGMRAITSAPISTSAGDRERLFLASSATTIARMDPTLSADSGAAIVSRYRLPFEDYGSPRRKRIRETILEGIGAPLVQWSRDWGTLTAGSTITLGTSPAIADARQRLAMRGNSFSLQLGAASGAWQVNRVQVNLLDEQSGPEIDT